MRRRQYLAAALAGSGAALAGCISGFTEEVRLNTPNEEASEDMIDLVYEHEGEEILAVTHMHEHLGSQVVQIRSLIQQPQETELESLELSLTPVTAPASGIERYVEPARVDQFDDVEIYREDDSTVIEIDEPSPASTGTSEFNTVLVLMPGFEEVSVQATHTIELAEDGLFGTKFEVIDSTNLEVTVDLD